MTEKLKNCNIVLASASPRRQQLLAGLDIKFEVLIPQVDEFFPEEMPVEEVKAKFFTE